VEVTVIARSVISFGLGLAAALFCGWIALPYVLYRQIEQPMQFNHQVHVGDELGMSCTDCHSFDDKGRFTGIPVVASCEPCHSEPIGESLAEAVLAREHIAEGREVEWLVYSRQPDNVFFPHSTHVNLASIECQRCHGDHGTTESLRPFEQNRLSGYSRDIWGPSNSRFRRAEHEGMKMSDCTSCHRASGVRDSCLICHK
jgi:menaquinone reductase, multiheme cytochrome c subunit